MVYEWKIGSRIKADADAAGQQFETLERTGGLTAERVVDANRPEDAPLHDAFEWDNEAAAEEWRKQQARHLINCICIKAETAEDKPPQQVRAFFITAATDGYENTGSIMSVEVKRESLLAKALMELQAFQRKYAMLQSLQPVFAAIDSLQGEEEE